jgi:hypothetical protein
MSDETMIPYFHQLADKGMGLDAAVIADAAILLYLCEGADKTMVAYLATIQIDRLDNGGLFAETDVIPYTGL